MKKKADIKQLTVCAMLIALAFLSVFALKFKVSFLSFDFKDAILSVIAFLYGPLWAVLSALATALLEFFTISDTGVYGLIMNFISSATFTLATGLVYKRMRSFTGAIVASVSAIFSVTAVMMLANLFITPYYMHVSQKEIIKNIPTLFLPFNLAKSTMNAAITLIIYKPLTTLLRRVGLMPKTEEKFRFSAKAIILTVVSVCVLALTTAFIILKLNGKIIFF